MSLLCMPHASVLLLRKVEAGDLGCFSPPRDTADTLSPMCAKIYPLPCLALDEVAAWFALVLHKDLHKSYFLGEKSHRG